MGSTASWQRNWAWMGVVVVSGMFAVLLHADAAPGAGEPGTKDGAQEDSPRPAASNEEMWRERVAFAPDVEATARNEAETWEVDFRSRVEHGWQQRCIVLERENERILEMSLTDEGVHDEVEYRVLERRWIGEGRRPMIGGREIRRSRGGSSRIEPEPGVLLLAPPESYPYRVRLPEGASPRFDVHGGPALSEKMQRTAQEHFDARLPFSRSPKVPELSRLSEESPRVNMSALAVHQMLGIEQARTEERLQQPGNIRFNWAKLELQTAEDPSAMTTRKAEVELPVVVRARRNIFTATLTGTLTFDAERHWPLEIKLEAEIDPMESINVAMGRGWSPVGDGPEGTVRLERHWDYSQLEPAVAAYDPEAHVSNEEPPELATLRTVLQEALPEQHEAHDAESVGEALNVMTLLEREHMRAHAHAMADAIWREREERDDEENKARMQSLTAVRDIPERPFDFNGDE